MGAFSALSNGGFFHIGNKFTLERFALRVQS